jgi:hypothetical protein
MPGMMAPGMLFLMWPISLSSLILIRLGIVGLVRELAAKK